MNELKDTINRALHPQPVEDEEDVSTDLVSNQTLAIKETPILIRFFSKRLAVEITFQKFSNDPQFSFLAEGVDLLSFSLENNKINDFSFGATLGYGNWEALLIDLSDLSRSSIEAIKKAINRKESIIFYFAVDKNFSEADFEKTAKPLIFEAIKHCVKQPRKDHSFSFDINVLAGEMSFAEFIERCHIQPGKNNRTLSSLNQLKVSNEIIDLSEQTVVAETKPSPKNQLIDSKSESSPSLFNVFAIMGEVALIAAGLMLIFFQPHLALLRILLIGIGCGAGVVGIVGILGSNTPSSKMDGEKNSWESNEINDSEKKDEFNVSPIGSAALRGKNNSDQLKSSNPANQTPIAPHPDLKDA